MEAKSKLFKFIGALFIGWIFLKSIASPDNKDLMKIKSELSFIKSEIDIQKQSSYYINGEVFKLKSLRKNEVELNPSTKGFQKIDSDLGTFLVSLEDIKPYADGYKVNLNIGNINFANYDNVVATYQWGKSFNEKDDTYGEWIKSLRSGSTQVSRLKPGSWNKVSFVISPAKPEETGYISVSLEPNSVSLAHR